MQFSNAPVSASALGGPTNGGPSATPPPTSVPIQLQTLNAVAYEDEYPSPGDADYNDFLSDFQITEKFNSSNDITDIYIDFYPRAVGAGFDHQFKLVLTGVVTGANNNTKPLPVTAPMFNGSAQVTLSYYNSSGVLSSSSSVPYNQDIVVFSSTHGAFGQSGGILDTNLPSGYSSGVPSNYIAAQQNARVHVALASPNLNPGSTNGQITSSGLRMILHTFNTDLSKQFDVDTINTDPNNHDSNGYPFGFIIPTKWQWMQEGVAIDKGYPEFDTYRQFLLGLSTDASSMNWFNAPVTGAAASTTLYPAIPFTAFLPAP